MGQGSRCQQEATLKPGEPRPRDPDGRCPGPLPGPAGQCRPRWRGVTERGGPYSSDWSLETRDATTVRHTYLNCIPTSRVTTSGWWVVC